MSNRNTSRIVILSVFLCAALAHPQSRKVLDKVTALPSIQEGVALPISVDLITNAGIRRVQLWYRPFGVSEFRELEMLLAGRSATATIPGTDVRPPFVEYFVTAQMENDSTESIPEQNPQSTPLSTTVRQLDPKDQEIRIMSPEPGETVSWEDLVVAVSLYYASPAINPNYTRIYFDNVDVSTKAILTEDVILYAPKNYSQEPQLGQHLIRVEVRDTAGNPYHQIRQSFNVSTSEALEQEKARLAYFGDGSIELRNEKVTGTSAFYGRGDFRATGEWSGLKFGTQLRYDNQEAATRQPQNRYLLLGSYGSYINVQVGDAYPRFPVMAMSGKRVRGVTASLNTGYVNLDVSVGETERLVEGTRLYDTTYADTSLVNSRPKNSLRKNNFFNYEIFSPGVFTREFYGFRPSFGSGENFQFGVTFLKFRDKLGSITRGIRPAENLVTGMDVLLAFDDQRAKFDAQAMLGLANTDISGGNFTDADYDSLKVQGQDVRDLGKLAEKFLTVNANLSPLNPIAAGLPGFAFDANASLNYFDNYLRANFTRRGGGYRSFGNEFLQTDLQGYTVSDNLRLLSNKLFLSLAYDSKSDNIGKTKSATTELGNFSTSVTISPGAGYPTVQVGYGRLTRLSDATVRQPRVPDFLSAFFDSSKSADDITNRFTVGSSFDFTSGNRYAVSASVSSLNRKDQTIYKRDQSSLLFQTNVTTYFKIPLQASVGLLVSQTKGNNQLFKVFPDTGSPTYLTQVNALKAAGTMDSVLTESKLQFTTLTLGAQYRLMDDQVRLIASISPTFGDLNRFSIRGGGDYTYLKRHTFELALDYINLSSSSNFIAAFTYRFNF
jgi:hypothetical protein